MRVVAQHSLVGTYWHYGTEFITILTETDSTLATVTMTLHEGSSVTHWHKTSDPNVFLCPNQIGNAWTDTIIYYQDSIVHKTVGEQVVLLIYGRERTLNNILLRYEGRSANKRYEFSHGFDAVLESDIRRRILGTFHARERMQVWHVAEDIGAQEIVSVTQAEYDSHRNQYVQLFDTTAISATERQQTIEKYYSTALDDEEKCYYNQGDLQKQVGRFTPSGVKGVYIHHPLDGFSRLYLNDMIYDTPLHCDNYNFFSNGLFAGGYYKEDSLQGSLFVYSVQGWDILNVTYVQVPRPLSALNGHLMAGSISVEDTTITKSSSTVRPIMKTA